MRSDLKNKISVKFYQSWLKNETSHDLIGFLVKELKESQAYIVDIMALHQGLNYNGH